MEQQTYTVQELATLFGVSPSDVANTKYLKSKNPKASSKVAIVQNGMLENGITWDQVVNSPRGKKPGATVPSIAAEVTEDPAVAAPVSEPATDPAPDLASPGPDEVLCDTKHHTDQEEVKRMSKNKLSDLNNHLFAQMERISNEDLSGDRLVEEINRAKAVTEVSREIISNANLLLRARQYATGVSFSGNAHLPFMLEE